MTYTCKICGSTFKSKDLSQSPKHIATKRHQTALNGGKLASERSKSKYMLVKSTDSTRIKDLTFRIVSLEDSVKFLLDKVKILENTVVCSGNGTENVLQIQLKEILISIIPLNKSLSVDKTLGNPRLMGMPERDIIKAIKNLIKDGILALEKGESKKKIQGIFGLIRHI